MPSCLFVQSYMRDILFSAKGVVRYSRYCFFSLNVFLYFFYPSELNIHECFHDGMGREGASCKLIFFFHGAV